MFCPRCGAQNEGNAPFCGKCGSPLTQQPAYQQPTYQQPAYQQPAYQQPTYQQSAYGQNLSWKEFYTRYAAKGTKSSLGWMVGICFFTAAISLLSLVLVGNVLGILDILVYTLMGILLLTQKKFVFALIPTIYSGIWSVVSLVASGTVTGVVAIIAGVICIKGLSKLDKAYKEYQATGICPATQI